MDINKHIIVGNVGKDPEIRTTQSGIKIASFSVATSRKFKKNGETTEETQWHRIVVFDKQLVEVAERMLQKGTRVYVEGAVVTRSWEKDGETKYATETVLGPYNSVLAIQARGRQAGNGVRNDDPDPPARGRGRQRQSDDMADDTDSLGDI